MTIRDWIRNRETHGFPTFSFEELKENFAALSEQVIWNELYRLNSQKRIASVYKGFYVIIPPQYAAKGVVPPPYYIDYLMKFLCKPYYVAGLNAAELWGAAHQRPQLFSVMTIPPRSTVSTAKNNLISWIYRREIPEKFLSTRNTEIGVIKFSNPELTAIDLVQYEQHIGGLSRATTILSELVEKTNFVNSSEELLACASLSTIQRLGYILDVILDETKQADTLYTELQKYGKRLNYISLSRREKEFGKRNKRWRVVENILIEPDEV